MRRCIVELVWLVAVGVLWLRDAWQWACACYSVPAHATLHARLVRGTRRQVLANGARFFRYLSNALAMVAALVYLFSLLRRGDLDMVGQVKVCNLY